MLTLAPGRPDSPGRPGSPLAPLGPLAPDGPRSPGAPCVRRERVKQGLVTQSLGHFNSQTPEGQRKYISLFTVWRSFIDLLQMRRLNSDRFILVQMKLCGEDNVKWDTGFADMGHVGRSCMTGLWAMLSSCGHMVELHASLLPVHELQMKWWRNRSADEFLSWLYIMYFNYINSSVSVLICAQWGHWRDTSLITRFIKRIISKLYAALFNFAWFNNYYELMRWEMIFQRCHQGQLSQ